MGKKELVAIIYPTIRKVVADYAGEQALCDDMDGIEYAEAIADKLLKEQEPTK